MTGLACVKAMNDWDRIREHLQKKVSSESYNNWLRGASFIGMEGDTVFVSAPDRETRTWLETEYAVLVRGAIQELGLHVRHVSYECAAAPASSADFRRRTGMGAFPTGC